MSLFGPEAGTITDIKFAVINGEKILIKQSVGINPETGNRELLWSKVEAEVFDHDPFHNVLTKQQRPPILVDQKKEHSG